MTTGKTGRSREILALRVAPWLILLCGLGAVACLRFTALNLGINTDTAEMLSEALPFRQAYERYRLAFPQHVDQLVVVVDGRSPEVAESAAARLADRLRHDTDIFSEVYLPGSDVFFRRNALLYLSEAELANLSDRLLRIQPFIGRITRDPSVKQFVDTLGQAIDASDDAPGLPLDSVFMEFEQAVQGQLDGNHNRISWQQLVLGSRNDGQDLRRYIFLKPVLDFSEPLAAEPAMLGVRAAVRDLELNRDNGVRVRITGDAALGYEELMSAMDGATIAGVLALIMVTAILAIGLGSVWMMLACLTTLITGLIFTAGFATAALGHLNLISIAFAVLYIGLGVDYAIHVCLRYRDRLRQGEAKLEAIANAIRTIRSSLVLCTLTTATAFYAFVPTAFSGVSELGLISGTGMFINLLLSLVLLPACLALLPTPSVTGQRTNRATYLDGPLRCARPIRILSIVFGIVAMVLIPQLKFDRNPLNLRDADSESVSTLRELMTEGENPGFSITVLVSDTEDEDAIASRLRDLPVVRDVISAGNFVPETTDTKLDLIDDLTLMLGSSIDTLHPPAPHTAVETTAALSTFREKLEKRASPAARRLADRLSHYLDSLSGAPDNIQSKRLEDLRESLLGELDAGLSRVRDALVPQSATWADLPPQLQRRWVAEDGLQRLAVYPSEDINDNAALRRFVESVQTIAPDATDEPVLGLRAGDAVVVAFRQAFTASFIVITGMLLVLLRDVRKTILIISPLILASLLTMGIMAGFSIPFNFANVIALPLLFGVGVDNSIHMVQRAGTLRPNGPLNPLRTSTAKAVLLSSLTTLCSFVNLLYSPHPGTASMGLLLTIGIGMMLLSTLVVLPALLKDRNT